MKKLLLVTMCFYTIFLFGCGGKTIDQFPTQVGNNVKINVDWPVKRINNPINYAPPAEFNITTIEINLIPIDSLPEELSNAETLGDYDFSLLKEVSNILHYSFDVRPGQANENGATIESIPTGNYGFVFIPYDSYGDTPFYYYENISINDNSTTYVNIEYDSWVILVPINNYAPEITSKTSNSADIMWANDLEAVSYNLYINNSLVDSISNTENLNSFLAYTITGLENGVTYEVKITALNNTSGIIRENSVLFKTLFFADNALSTEIISQYNLQTDNNITTQDELTPELLSSSNFTSFSYSISNPGPSKSLPLKAPTTQISDLTGLEFCTSLQNLDLSGNIISDISSLSSLINLNSLNISGNSIISLSALSGLTSLSQLDLSNNSINDISILANLSALTSLNLSNNTISDVSALSSLSTLTNLALSGNSETLDISSIAGLGLTMDIPQTTVLANFNISPDYGTMEITFSVKYIPITDLYISIIKEDSTEIYWPVNNDSNIPYQYTQSTIGTTSIKINTQDIPDFANIETLNNTFRLTTSSGTIYNISPVRINNTPHPPILSNVNYNINGNLMNISYNVQDDFVNDTTCEILLSYVYNEVTKEININEISGDIGTVSIDSNVKNISFDYTHIFETDTLPVIISSKDNMGYSDSFILNPVYNLYESILLTSYATEMPGFLKHNAQNDPYILYSNMQAGGIHMYDVKNDSSIVVDSYGMEPFDFEYFNGAFYAFYIDSSETSAIRRSFDNGTSWENVTFDYGVTKEEYSWYRSADVRNNTMYIAFTGINSSEPNSNGYHDIYMREYNGTSFGATHEIFIADQGSTNGGPMDGRIYLFMGQNSYMMYFMSSYTNQPFVITNDGNISKDYTGSDIVGISTFFDEPTMIRESSGSYLVSDALTYSDSITPINTISAYLAFGYYKYNTETSSYEKYPGVYYNIGDTMVDYYDGTSVKSISNVFNGTANVYIPLFDQIVERIDGGKLSIIVQDLTNSDFYYVRQK